MKKQILKLLAWMFNYLNTMDFIGRKIRQVSNVPILFLSSRDNPMDQVMSMELGADDYMQNHFILTS